MLVGVERVLDESIERLRRRELDLTGDAERDEDGAARGGSRCHESIELLGGQHVQQRRGGDQGCARQRLGLQPGDVELTGLEGDRRPVAGPVRRVGRNQREQLGVPVVHHPVLGSGKLPRQPAGHRPGAAAEVVDDRPAAGGQVRTDLLDEVAGPGCRVGRLTQAQPIGAGPHGLGARPGGIDGHTAPRLPCAGRQHAQRTVPMDTPTDQAVAWAPWNRLPARPSTGRCSGPGCRRSPLASSSVRRASCARARSSPWRSRRGSAPGCPSWTCVAAWPDQVGSSPGSTDAATLESTPAQTPLRSHASAPATSTVASRSPGSLRCRLARSRSCSCWRPCSPSPTSRSCCARSLGHSSPAGASRSRWRRALP